MAFAASPRASVATRSLPFPVRPRAQPLGHFGILERQSELIGRQLLETLAEAFALRGAQDVLQPTIGLLHLASATSTAARRAFR